MRAPVELLMMSGICTVSVARASDGTVTATETSAWSVPDEENRPFRVVVVGSRLTTHPEGTVPEEIRKVS